LFYFYSEIIMPGAVVGIAVFGAPVLMTTCAIIANYFNPNPHNVSATSFSRAAFDEAANMSKALVPSQQTCDAFLPVAEMSKALVHVPPLTGTCEAPGVCEAITSTGAEVFSLSPEFLVLAAVGTISAVALLWYCLANQTKESPNVVAQKTIEAHTKARINQTQPKLIEQLNAFERSLAKLSFYEVSSSTQLAVKEHIKAINDFKATLSTSKTLDKTHLNQGKTLLEASLKTMEKATFQSRGGINNEKSILFTGYCKLITCARQAFNLFTRLFAQLGLVSHKDVANPVAKALIGQSFFFQVRPTPEENAVIKAQQQALSDASEEIKQLKPLTVG
jgi:hypothetical protein